MPFTCNHEVTRSGANQCLANKQIGDLAAKRILFVLLNDLLQMQLSGVEHQVSRARILVRGWPGKKKLLTKFASFFM